MAFSGSDVALAFVGGFLAALIISLLVGVIILQRSDAYGLGHWKLNIKMPLATMWMNLGYWSVYFLPKAPALPYDIKTF
jgi:hypothetical protein